ncbi:reverse transcriptase-like protein [Jeotgalibacillus campisalis]|uniref:Ribonuclease H n=1 Tax=Jeotgalibacillus campisalis TaxID=220754 RepID=A0A0C2VGM2_9BACL|nr:reverse transcriptase-like protein [Jeotgalibacillus campisalis]KIL48007.1 ribonuclease H [Jeotgalibacillus campisalis]
MEIRLHFDYKHPTLPSVAFSSDWMHEDVSLKMIQDLEKTGRMKELKIEDDMGQTWTLKEYKKLLSKEEDQIKDVQLYFDGSFNPVSQMAGAGIVLTYTEGNKRYRIRENLLLTHLNTNNEAEYAALYRGLQLCGELGVTHQKIRPYGDSLVVINQLNGEWPCYEKELNNWIDKIEGITKRMSIQLELTAIRRNDNKEADKLASQALEGSVIKSKSEI